MAVKIRLARGGAKKVPYYRIVVANATAPRDGDFLEKVGTYNPLLQDKDAQRVTLKTDRIAYWLSQGATPTDRVAKFLEAAGVDLPSHIKHKMLIKLKSRTTKLSKKAPKEVGAPAPVAAVAPVATVEEVVEAPKEEVVVQDTAAASEVVVEVEVPNAEVSEVAEVAEVAASAETNEDKE